jgi:Flp pilus assembly protein CpaB
MVCRRWILRVGRPVRAGRPTGMRARGRRVRNWRVLTAIAAVVLAALAGVLVWKYTDNAKQEAKKPFEFASVLVAKTRVPASTSFERALDAGMIVRENRVRNDVPASVIAGAANDLQLKKQHDNLVASHDIAEGQTVVSEDFVSSGSVASNLGGQLESDQGKDRDSQLMAMSVQLDEQSAVAGFLVPGDTVNVMVTMAEDAKHWVATGDGHVKFTSFLVPGLKVLAVGQTTAKPATQAQTASSDGTTPTTTATTSQNRSLITLEVTARQAQQLVHAQDVGKIYLSLNPTSFKAGDFKDPGEIVEAVNLFDKSLPTLDRELGKLQDR